MIEFEPIEEAEDGDHTFGIYACRSTSLPDLISGLAQTIRRLYVDPARLKTVLSEAISGLEVIIDTSAIQEAIDRTLTAAIPEAGTHPVPQLDVARNELAEALAYLAIQVLNGTVVPAPRIKHKEIPSAPARGLDLLGLEDEPLVAVVSETKASEEDAHPPAVVGVGTTSLRGQFLRFLGEPDRMLAELNWAFKHANTEHQSLIARAMLAHVSDKLPVVIAPVLVRPAELGHPDDFGTFRQNSEEFDPARIRFVLLTIDGAIDAMAQAVYAEARK